MRRDTEDARLCAGLTDGVKMPGERVWHHPPRHCRQWASRGSRYCRWHQPVAGGWVSRDEAERIVLDMMSPPAEPAAQDGGG